MLRTILRCPVHGDQPARNDLVNFCPHKAKPTDPECGKPLVPVTIIDMGAKQ